MRNSNFFFQAEDGIRDAQESRGLGDVYKRQSHATAVTVTTEKLAEIASQYNDHVMVISNAIDPALSLIHI